MLCAFGGLSAKRGVVCRGKAYSGARSWLLSESYRCVRVRC